ncbi:MAG: hypothetical protein K8H84_12420 [Sulfuricella denitrificans]|nr:hypothetical protein [Sulfuricella denitrificans]
MDLQNLGYALTQVVHNFGASAVVGGAIAALWLGPRPEPRHAIAWLVVSGWVAQIVSGATFGAISFHYYGQFPDISTVAMIALTIKVACAASGLALAFYYIIHAASRPESWRHSIWLMLAALGAIALISAAFLRWFS